MGQTFAEATTPYGCRWPEIPRNLQGMSLSALSQEFDIPQERRVVTAIPGPKSDALMQRRTAAVARGSAWFGPLPSTAFSVIAPDLAR